jgi:tetratricopeptide (TPR) repeat protein
MKQIIVFFALVPFFAFSQSNFEKGEKLFREKKFVQAQPFFEKVLKENPNNLKTIEYLGDIAGYNESWDKAIYYYKKLKELRPTEANYYYKYGGALGMKASSGNKIMAIGLINPIKDSFEKAIQLESNHIDAHWALIIYYLELPRIFGGSEKKAVLFSNKLQKISPVDGYLSKGYIEEYYKRYTNAEILYKKAIALGSSKAGPEMLANLYKKKVT